MNYFSFHHVALSFFKTKKQGELVEVGSPWGKGGDHPYKSHEWIHAGLFRETFLALDL